MRSLVFCFTILSYVVLSTQKKNAIDSNRIVGGEEISIRKAPYQVALIINNEFACGAVILAPKTVLSAAHCYVGYNIDLYKIRAGSSYHAEGGEVRQVVEFRSHAKYDAESSDYDIAILKLKRNLEFNDKIASIEMKNEGETVPDGDMLFVSGWGLLKDNSKGYNLFPNKLHGVSVEKIPTKTCIELYENLYEITPRMICAGRGVKDSCLGDSGGPAVHNDKLAGIVSFGIRCAGRQPGVYTKVSVLRKWIDNHMKEFEGRGLKQSILKEGTLA